MAGAEEMLVLVDDCDNEIGTESRANIHANGLYHRAVHVLLLDEDNNILLQKRAASKATNPNRWTSTASGHVDAGDTYDQTAPRELYEETKIDAPDSMTSIGKIVLDARSGDGREICKAWTTVYVARVASLPDGAAQAEEVSRLEAFPLEAVLAAAFDGKPLCDRQGTPVEFAGNFPPVLNLYKRHLSEQDLLSDNADKTGLGERLKAVKEDIAELGGPSEFTSGNWLLRLIARSFRAYYANANAEYFHRKYPNLDADQIAKKLTSVAARNAALMGVVVGATVSVDEIVGIVTTGGGGIGLPANIAVAVTAVLGEAVLLVRLQLQLVANLAKLYGVPLDPDDPEDILLILGFALGGSAAEAAGKFAAKTGGKIAGKTVRKYVSKEVLAALKELGRRIGVKILQRTVVKYVVPIASMGIGGMWNYISTKAVSKVARKHFKERAAQMKKDRGN